MAPLYLLTTRRSTSSNILTATYGWPRLTDEHIPLVKRIHAHTARLSNACIPGTSMVDLFPILNYLPSWFAKWKQDALEWHQRESEMFEGFNAGVAKKMVSGEKFSRWHFFNHICFRRKGGASIHL